MRLSVMTPAGSGRFEGELQYGDRPQPTDHIPEDLLGILPDNFNLRTRPEHQNYIPQPELMTQTGLSDIGDGLLSASGVDFDYFINFEEQMNATVAVNETPSFVAEIENRGLNTDLDSGELPSGRQCSTNIASQEIPNDTGGELDGTATTGLIVSLPMKPPDLLSSSTAMGTQNQSILKETPHNTLPPGIGSAWSEWCWDECGYTWFRFRMDENGKFMFSGCDLCDSTQQLISSKKNSSTNIHKVHPTLHLSWMSLSRMEMMQDSG
jgi:hypothetical protein